MIAAMNLLDPEQMLAELLFIPGCSVIAVSQCLGLTMELPGACPTAACSLFGLGLAGSPPWLG